MKKWSIVFGGSLLLSTIAQAQAFLPMDSVIIRENRIQSSLTEQNRLIEVLDQRQIKALPVRTTNELLSYVSGIDLRQRGPASVQSDVTIDGSTFDQVLVLINGVKMSDPQTGHHTLNIPIPLSAIDHIEVIRGAAANKYGVNALAGAINIVTKLPVKDELYAQVYAGSSFKTDSATGNTYNNWGVQASGALASKKQSHIFSVAHDEGNGYRYNTAFNAYRLFYQNRIELNKKNAIEAMGGYIFNDFGANAFYAAPADVNSIESVQTALASVKYTIRPNSKVSIAPRVSYRYNSDDYTFIKQKPEVYHNFHETNVATAELQSTILLNNGILGLGAEYRNEKIGSSNLGKHTRDNIGLYAEYKHNFSRRLNAGAGLYGNYNSDYNFQVFPGVDVGYKVANQVKVFANASAAQRLPSYTDLYYKGPSNIGNSELRPEYSKYAEAGVQYNISMLTASASYFYRNIDDFIDWVRAENSAPWQPRNFQSINTNGFKLQTKWDLGKQFIAPDKLQSVLNVSYTYLDPVIEAPSSEISKYAIEALRHQAIISTQNILFNSLFVNVSARYQYRINANDYTLVDARVGYQWRSWAAYVDANNILNTQYKEIGTVPLPGSWYSVGLRFNIAEK